VFLDWSSVGADEQFLQSLCEKALNRATLSDVWPSGVSSSSITAEFPKLFSSAFG
jgi:hypothetical protein